MCRGRSSDDYPCVYMCTKHICTHQASSWLTLLVYHSKQAFLRKMSQVHHPIIDQIPLKLADNPILCVQPFEHRDRGAAVRRRNDIADKILMQGTNSLSSRKRWIVFLSGGENGIFFGGTWFRTTLF